VGEVGYISILTRSFLSLLLISVFFIRYIHKGGRFWIERDDPHAGRQEERQGRCPLPVSLPAWPTCLMNQADMQYTCAPPRDEHVRVLSGLPGRANALRCGMELSRGKKACRVMGRNVCNAVVCSHCSATASEAIVPCYFLSTSDHRFYLHAHHVL
jgi:hypothetical protein